MENNVVKFPKSPAALTPRATFEDRMQTQARNREGLSAKAQTIRALLKSRPKPTANEARQLVRNLGCMIEEAGLRRSGGMAELKKRVGGTFAKQRDRYVQFSDEPQKRVARDGGVFLNIADNVATWTDPDDPQLAKDGALLRLSIGIPRLARGSTNAKSTNRDASEAYGRLINLLALGVGEIAHDCELSQYFHVLSEDDLELGEDQRFSAKRVQDGFSLSQIFDDAMLSEAQWKIPRYLPRIRVATLYRRHVATTVLIPEPNLSAEERTGPESLYQAGLRRLGLKPVPRSDGAYPPAPSGWDKLEQGGIDSVFERLDVWLVIAPDGRAEAVKPAFIFMSGESETSDGDVWWSRDSFETHANNCALYFSSAAEGDDPGAEGWSKSNSSLIVEPLQAILHSRDHANQLLAPGRFHCLPNDATSALELRAQVPNLTPLVWHRTEGYGSIIRFLYPIFEPILFQRCFFWNNNENDYTYASPRPSAFNDTPILIRRFVDPETWSPGPMKSLGGALLGNLLGPRESSVLTALRQSAETLRAAMDDFNAQGREDFEWRYKLRMTAIDEDGATRDER